MFETNPSLRHFNFKPLLKYESIIHNNASSSEKVFWSESGEKSAQIKQRLQAKTVQNSSKQYVAGFWSERLHCKKFFGAHLKV